MKRFRFTVKICVYSFERDSFYVLIYIKQQREKVVKEIKQ